MMVNDKVWWEKVVRKYTEMVISGNQW